VHARRRWRAANARRGGGLTADGVLRAASAEAHPVLFGGLRGGGGTFGVATSSEYRLHPVGPIVLAGVMLHPAAKMREVLSFYRDFVATAPDELTTHRGPPDGAARPLPSSVGARATGRRHRRVLRRPGTGRRPTHCPAA